MTEDQLKDIEGRLGAATYGPWNRSTYGNQVLTGDSERTICRLQLNDNFNQINDADFIAHAREDVVLLLAEVRRLRAEHERTQTRLDNSGTTKSLDEGETHNLCDVANCDRCHCHHCHTYALEQAALGRIEKRELIQLLRCAVEQRIDDQWLADAKKALNSPITDSDHNEEKRFHEALLLSGLVKEIKPPRTIPTRKRRLMQVEGKPLSKTVIEER